MILLDGSYGEGGGQILRTALSISMIIGKSFRISNIRANRRKPGLMRQHLTAVKAAATICQAEVDGAVLNSTELTFKPGSIRGGNYHFSVGTAGSTMLVLQTLLPALLEADSPSQVVLEGGTHNPFAPPFDFIEQTFVPVLRKMGAKVTLSLERHGFYPGGGGLVRIDVSPIERWNPVHLHRRGQRIASQVRVLHANLPGNIAKRELAICGSKLNLDDASLAVRFVTDSNGPGNVVLGIFRFEEITKVWAGFGQMGKRAERVASELCKQVKTYLKTTAPVGEYLADQLMLPFALAGCGSFLTGHLSRHAKTNLTTVHQFLRTTYRVIETEEGIQVAFSEVDGG